MADKRIYKNKNGTMELIDFVKMIHEDILLDYMRKFRVSDNPCPPYELIDDSISCFYCMDCWKQCESKVKKYKNHYTIGKKKILKEELDDKNN